MAIVYLALGSNLGERKQNIVQALDVLMQKGLAIDTVAPLYVSRALGFDGQEFYNTVVRVKTQLDTYNLIALIHEIEAQMGRVRNKDICEDRIIDIDVLLYDDMVASNSEVTIPHRSIGQRDFVLCPLLDIDKTLVDPMSDELFADVLSKIPQENKTILDVIHDWYVTDSGNM